MDGFHLTENAGRAEARSPERSRHCSSERACIDVTEGDLGKAQASDELEPGELPD